MIACRGDLSPAMVAWGSPRAAAALRRLPARLLGGWDAGRGLLPARLCAAQLILAGMRACCRHNSASVSFGRPGDDLMFSFVAKIA
jgi:hypothetical protein